jgi:hypothetical protein
LLVFSPTRLRLLFNMNFGVIYTPIRFEFKGVNTG